MTPGFPASSTFALFGHHQPQQNKCFLQQINMVVSHPKNVSAARKITIKRGLTDIKTTERETATFEVELSHPQVAGVWMRNGIQLKQTNHFRMSAKGRVHSLTISNLSIEDTGTFTFCVERLKTSARLVVKGKGCFFWFFFLNQSINRVYQESIGVKHKPLWRNKHLLVKSAVILLQAQTGS